MAADMTLEELVDEILAVVGDVSERYALLLEAGVNMKAVSDARQAARAGAEAWARTLSNPADDTGPFVARNLVRAAFGGRPPADFWGTPLGQLVIARGGFPDGEVSRREAAAVLGMTWHGARARWMAGTLARYVDPKTRKETNGFKPESVMVEWHRRHRDRVYAQMQELASAGDVVIGEDPINERPRARAR